LKPSTGATVRDHRNAVRDRSESLSAINRKPCPQSPESVPIVLVGEDYWRRAFNMAFLVDEGVIDPEDRELFSFAETATEIWNGIRHWYDVFGTEIAPMP
jgi:predicted Rossmann-fold nucleotide-binding protein